MHAERAQPDDVSRTISLVERAEQQSEPVTLKGSSVQYERPAGINRSLEGFRWAPVRVGAGSKQVVGSQVVSIRSGSVELLSAERAT